jgi:hypothetical protein
MYSTTADFYRAELEYRREQRRLQGRTASLRRRARTLRNLIGDGHAA